jgi:hypothetical protein
VRLPRSSRERLAGRLTTAYAEGLLSEATLSHRIGELFGHTVVNPQRLVGDLSVRSRRWPPVLRLIDAAQTLGRRLRRDGGVPGAAALLLGLDWGSGVEDDLLMGRDARICDVVLADHTVSRRHAQLRRRDGRWTIEDLRSTNGILVNGQRVGRCQLRPGDRIFLGGQQLEVD